MKQSCASENAFIGQLSQGGIEMLARTESWSLFRPASDLKLLLEQVKSGCIFSRQGLKTSRDGDYLFQG